ncbi:hypothetical protein EIP86_004967 [Pleurotus ostreatoroseus]|nr:hypothetical protein EIP86_004967 [Pleurotus ostreatoroseus]
MPLSVYLHVSCIRMPRVLYHTFDLMSRIRELRLTGELSELNNLHLLFNHPAPELEVFAFSASVIKHWCLDGKRSRRYGVRELLGRPQAANRYRKSHQLPLLFLGHHPRLESLYLRFFIHFGYNAFHTIKKLHLSRQFFTTPKRFKLFLDLLDGMPRLEELILSWVDFGTDLMPSIDIGSSQIHLKSLQRLALIGLGTPDIERVLQCLVLPPDLALSCDMGCNWGENIEDLCALLRDRLRNARHVEIEFDSSYSHANILVASATFAVRFVACGYGASDDVGNYLAEIAQHADVQDLWIRLLSRTTGPVEIDPIELGGYFALLKSLYIEFPGSKTQVYLNDWLTIFGREIDARNLHFLVEFLPTAQMKAYIEEIMGESLTDVRVYTTDAVRRSSAFHPLVEDFKIALNKKGFGSVDFLPARRFPKIPLPPVCVSTAGAGWEWSKRDQFE